MKIGLVDQRAQDAEIGSRMRIRLDLHQGLGLAHFGTPDLRPTDVDPLLTRKAVNHRRGLATQGELVGLGGHRQARGVGNILAQRQFAVDEVALHRAVACELFDQRTGLCGKAFIVFFGPPVAQIAQAIVLAALVIKAMADFMANHTTYGTVVNRIFGLGVKERRLQNNSREDDFVHLGVVVGVHRLRGHEPLVTVNRLAQFAHIAQVLKAVGAEHIAHQIIGADLQLGIVAPLIGVADFGYKGRQLGLGFFFGGGGHPVQVADTGFEGQQHVRHQLFHAHFAFSRKVLLHIQLAQGLTQSLVFQSHGPLPGRTQLRYTAERGAVERKARVHPVLRQIGSGGIQQLPREIGLPGLQWHGLQCGVKAREVAGLAHHDEGQLGAHARRIQVAGPVVASSQISQLGNLYAVVGFDGVAVFYFGPLHFGQGSFQSQHLARASGCIFCTGHSQCFFYMHQILIAHVFQARVIIFQVVVAVGQAQAVLHQVGHIDCGVFGILVNLQVVGCRHADVVVVGDQRRNLLLVFERSNARQLSLQGLQAQGVTRLVVHEAGVQVTNLLAFGAGLLGVFGRGLHDGAQLRLGPLV